MGKRIFKNLMCIYLIFLIFFVVLKFDGSFDELISIHQRIIENETMGIKNINLVLFRTITPYVSNITEPYALKNIIGNIIVFIPLGFLTSQLLVERCRKPIIMCVLIIVFIECMQLIFKIGFFDVDDIFLNLEMLCENKIETSDRSEGAINRNDRIKAMENMVHSLISDRLLELSKYVLLDPIGKRILIDKSSMQTDGYQVLIN